MNRIVDAANAYSNHPCSGLAVHPNRGDRDPDAIFGMAESATPDDQGQARRTITMVRFDNAFSRLVSHAPFFSIAMVL
jgi:hypothetical protein